MDAFLPAGLAALAAGGKLLAAIGASATVQARYDHETQNVALGAALLVVGLGCAVTAAIMFGIDVHKERPSHAHGLKAISIGAAITLAAGAAVHQYAVIADNVPLAWGASFISAMGFAAVSVSLPRFFTYSEAQRGLCLARTQDRAIAEQILGSTGLALLTAFAGLKRIQPLPPYVGSAVVTVGATMTLLHLALTHSDNYRHKKLLGHALLPSSASSAVHLGDEEFVAVPL